MRRIIRFVIFIILLSFISYTFITYTDIHYESEEVVLENEVLESLEVEDIEIVEDIQSTVRLDVQLLIYEFNEEYVVAIAKTLYGECRGVYSKMEKAAVVWCILNRVDAGEGNILDVITAPYQFIGYHENNPVLPELKELAIDVLTRWYLEQEGVEYVGRVLPSNYLWFSGRDGHNWFRCEYESSDYWDWSYENPYDN